MEIWSADGDYYTAKIDDKLFVKLGPRYDMGDQVGFSALCPACSQVCCTSNLPWLQLLRQRPRVGQLSKLWQHQARLTAALSAAVLSQVPKESEGWKMAASGVEFAIWEKS